MKKLLILTMVFVMSCFAFTGCGSDTDTATENTSTENTSDGTTSGDNNSISDDIGNIVDDAGNAVDDAANAVGDTVDNVTDAVTGNYSTYDDAYDYFMGMLPTENGNYEVTNSDKDLTEYTSGSHGYHFELHDSSNGEDSKIGDFYVDSDSGKIYKADEDGNMKEYDFSDLK